MYNSFSVYNPILGYEGLTVVVMKSTIFWDITMCSLLSVNSRFRETYRLHLQGRKIGRGRNQRESRWQAELVNPRFGGTYRLHLQGRKIRRARNQHESSACHLLSCWFLARLTLQPWKWRRHVPLTHRFTITTLHSVISQKTELFMLTAVITSDPTYSYTDSKNLYGCLR
jgi:hypothetical protein